MPARHHRVTRGDDYRRIVRSGNRVGSAVCITYAVSRSHNDAAPVLPARFGYIVSKAVGNAVTRNLVRRRMKAISEALIVEGLSGIEIVFRAHPAAATASFTDLDRELRTSVRRLTQKVQGAS